MKKIILFVLCSFLLVSCGGAEKNSEILTEWSSSATEKVVVSTSIIPLSALANTIGGDYIEVHNIVPAGVSPHGFDLSARQMVDISKSEKVFMIGLEHIDGFLDKAVEENKQVHLASGMELIDLSGGHDDDDGDEHHEEEGHDNHEGKEYHSEHHEDEHDDHSVHDDHNEHEGGNNHDEHNHSSDPHVWLGKENVIEIAKKIRNELTTMLPEQANYFSQNTETFIADVEELYNNFEVQVAGKTPGEFIVFHDAYNYLMQSIGMDMNLKVPFSQNVLHDTGTAYFSELVEEIEKHGITTAFSEPQFASGNLEHFSNQYKLEIGLLDPLGTNPNMGGYRENLKSNLENLTKVYE